MGVIAVRLFLPFDVEAFLAALPKSVKAIAVLDRTKEPGSIGEPLYLNVVTALAKGRRALASSPSVVGGRYGLGSKEFTPGMARAVFEHLSAARAQEPVYGRNHRRCERAPRWPSTPNSTSRAAGGQAMRVCRTGRRRHGRGEQEFDQDHRRADLKLRPGLLRLRLEEIGLDDDLAPALRPEADPRPLPDPAGGLRRLQPVQLRRAHRRPAATRPRGPPCSSIRRTPRRRPGQASERLAGDPDRKEAAPLRHRRDPGRPGERHGPAHEHGAPDLLLRALRRASARRGRSSRSRRRSTRPTARRASRSSR